MTTHVRPGQGNMRATFRIDFGPASPPKQRTRNRYLWRTADGRTIPVCDMSDTHLVSAIRYLVKWLLTRTPVGLTSRYRSSWTQHLYGQIQILLREAEDRKAIRAAAWEIVAPLQLTAPSSDIIDGEYTIIEEDA